MERHPDYDEFVRPMPSWYPEAKLGIFMHWGPYAVPGWAEPIGAHGTFHGEGWEREFNTHNPYAEWYYNTIRIEGSPARQHHFEAHGGRPYDDFLDQWTAADFDADDLLALVKRSGARYFVPTTKHHDGVTLWDAPHTGDRNTVQRGPRRDLVGEMRDAAERHGVRFGVYYSGGLDWHVDSGPPVIGPLGDAYRPIHAEYARYVHAHVADLIDRYAPEILWGDIEWPDAGKAPGEHSLIDLFRRFYARRPDGVVNDRWGDTHWDFRTSEYEVNHGAESASAWENCRGIGFSFAYNRLEDASHSMTGPETIRYFVDVVARGGNLLLNIGPTAEGRVTDIQRRALEELGAWNDVNGAAVFGSEPLPEGWAASSETPWIRWTRTNGFAHAFIDAPTGDVVSLEVASERIDAPSSVVVPDSDAPGPVVLSFPLR
ncbi:alpha-L-fucosidase [Microbacterium nanhaiense]|uniref:alpha-L-fucosidase n=1 Tax=Microbacterium nanhaiense TaxID=1301026 RepID=A0ABQ2N4X0_9MICO|nr:alpha-L-fucosidase [Microbacterium nanhaiense]